jgi:GH35 family endo-1,4-beta-xylanase
MKFDTCLSLGARLFAMAILLAGGPQTLREAATSHGILVGAAVRPSLFSEAAYSQTLAREFNMLEPEDALKWWVVGRDQRFFDFPGRRCRGRLRAGARHES